MSGSRLSHDVGVPEPRRPVKTFDNEWILEAFENESNLPR